MAIFLTDLDAAADTTARVLCVGSRETSQAITQHLDERFEGTTATTVETALERVETHDAIVATDEIDVLELLDRLDSEIPVVVASQQDSQDHVIRAVNRGADRYVRRAGEWLDESLLTDLRELADTYRSRQRRLEREREYGTILEDLQEGYYRTDAEGTVTRVTPAVAEMLGYDSTEAFLGQNVLQFYPDDADRSLVDALEANDGSVDNYELLLEHSDGSLVDVVTSSQFVIEDGEVVGVEGIFRDITERKAAERALQEREERLSAIYESSPTAISLATVDTGELLEVNEAFTEITGYEASEVVGKTVEELGIWATSEQRDAFIDDIIEHGQAHDREFRFRGKDGAEIHGLISGELVTIGGEEYLLATTLDITDRKERERELKRKNEQLDQFASIVSHDLRNPLGIAETYLDFARDTCDDADFDAVADALDRMDTMIEDILTFARAGGTIEGTQDTAIAALAEKSWETVDPEAGTLSVDTDASIPVDPDRFTHVFENLFANAVAHNDGPVTVRVGVDDGRTLYIADDGEGIPEADREEAFDHGYTTSEAGNGFGLSIVESIVEAHGWAITVTESAQGGARFEIDLTA